MRFAGLAVLTLGASAYVVTDQPKSNAVEFRNPVGNTPIPFFHIANRDQKSGTVSANHAISVVARHRESIFLLKVATCR
jgi:hypothetical protein